MYFIDKSLINIVKSQDETLLKIILLYFSILQQEILENRVLIEADNGIHLIQQKQANMLHELRVFSQHIKLESKGKVNVSFLKKESSQYKRCREAVKDKVSLDTVQRLGFDGLNILKILEIKHDLLLSQFQVSDHHNMLCYYLSMRLINRQNHYHRVSCPKLLEQRSAGCSVWFRSPHSLPFVFTVCMASDGPAGPPYPVPPASLVYCRPRGSHSLSLGLQTRS